MNTTQTSLHWSGYGTGAVATGDTIRQSVAFDLSTGDLGGRAIVAADLRLPQRPGAARIAAVTY